MCIKMSEFKVLYVCISPHHRLCRALSIRFLRLFLICSILLAATFQIHAQDSTGSKVVEGIFVSGSVEQMFAPGELADYVSPKPGWRAGTGWTLFLNERHSFPIFVESGYSFISGTNPLVRTFDIVPIALYGGYCFSPLPFLDLCVERGGGWYFGKVEHYETAIDLAEGNLITTKGGGLIVGAKLGAGIPLFERSLEIRLYGTIECILEKDGPVPLPGINVTCRFYPMKIYSQIHN